MFETKATGFSLKCITTYFVVQNMTWPPITFTESQDCSVKTPKVIYQRTITGVIFKYYLPTTNLIYDNNTSDWPYKKLRDLCALFTNFLMGK